MRRYSSPGCLCLVVMALLWDTGPAGAGLPFCLKALTTHRNAMDPVLVDAGGGAFAVAYRAGVGERYAVAVARLAADGALISGPVTVTPSSNGVLVMGLAWNGSSLGLLWRQHLGNGTGIFFRRLDADGTPLSGLLRVDDSVDPVGPEEVELPLSTLRPGGALAWDGQGWGASWHRRPAVPPPITVRFARIAADGRSKDPETLISDSSANASNPVLAWNGTDYSVMWLDDRSGALQIHYRRVAADGTPGAPSVAVTALPIGQLQSPPHFAWNGTELGVAWIDSRDGDRAVFIKRLNVGGAPISAEARLSDAPSVFSSQPIVAWLGDRWGVAAEDFRGGDLNLEIRLSFADTAGAKLGADVLVSSPVDPFFSDTAALAFAGGTLLAAWHDTVGADSMEIHAQALDVSGMPTALRQVLTAGHVPGWGTFLEPEIAPRPGGGLAVFYVDQHEGRDGGEAMLALTSPDGSAEALVEVADVTPAQAYDGAIAASDDTLAMAWTNAFGQLLFARFHPSGLKLGADLELSPTAVALGLAMTWSGSTFLVSWADRRDGNQEIYTAAVAADGTVLAAANRITADPQRSFLPAIAASPAERLVAWTDAGSTAQEVWVAPLDATGGLAGAAALLTADDGSASNQPVLASDGSGFALVHREAGAPDRPQVFLYRLSAAGVPAGPPTQISSCRGAGQRVVWAGDRWSALFAGCSGHYSAEVDAGGGLLAPERVVFRSPGLASRGGLAWDGERVVIAVTAGLRGAEELFLTDRSCAVDDTPPFCPGSLAGSPDGNGVLLTWVPGSDDDFALRWHYVARDGRRIAVLPPEATAFADDLPALGLHRYTVTAVNQGMVESSACQTVDVLSPYIFVDGFESGDVSVWTSSLP